MVITKAKQRARLYLMITADPTYTNSNLIIPIQIKLIIQIVTLRKTIAELETSKEIALSK